MGLFGIFLLFVNPNFLGITMITTFFWVLNISNKNYIENGNYIIDSMF